MCGITGIYSYLGKVVSRGELLAMRDEMALRGPDGSGIWMDKRERVGLGHRRLSILDLSEAGAQPMSHLATGNCIVFNGEIYNYLELRRDLELTGCVFRSDSDTEVLLHLYAVYGVEMLGRLRGMYAFALWDAVNETVFLARDPFGIKPLYYADSGRVFRFASQVRALLRGEVDSSPEPAGHVGFFLWGSVPEPYTLFRGIRALPAGHWMKVGQNGPSTPVMHASVTNILAKAAADHSVISRSEGLERISKAVLDSIGAHLVADVPVGVFLSAGLDSAMIAGGIDGGDALRTVTLGFEEYVSTLNDEVPLAEETARCLGARHSTVRVRRENFEAERTKLLGAMDQPSIDGVNTWFVAKAAASQGLKVTLSGLGGDELFGSYPSFHDVPRMAKLFSPINGIPHVGAAFRMVVAPALRHFSSPKYAGLLEYGGSFGGAYMLRRGLFMPWELPDVLDPDLAREGWKKLEAVRSLNAEVAYIGHDQLAVSALEMNWYMRNQLLRDADWAGMAHSLEIRVPLVDIRLLTTVAPILAAFPEITKRDVARAVAPHLPPQLFNRPKTGFSVPVRKWMLGGEMRGERGLRGWAQFVMRRYLGDAART